MKLTWDNILLFLLIIFIIIFPFWMGTPDNYCRIWEDVSIVATLVYAFLIYSVGFFDGRFKGLTEWQKGLIGIIVLLVIPLISLSFIIGFMRVISDSFEKLYQNHFNIGRIEKMEILISVCALFALVNFIMLKKAEKSNFNYATNFYFGDIPVTIAFGMLLVYSRHIGNDVIVERNLEHFFEGAIAFQLIVSNIIWMYNDDKFWESIITKKGE